MRYEGSARGQYGPGGQQRMESLKKDTARDLDENYVAGNPNLKVGEIEEHVATYTASIVTKDGSLVEKLVIDKNTGWMKRKY